MNLARSRAAPTATARPLPDGSRLAGLRSLLGLLVVAVVVSAVTAGGMIAAAAVTGSRFGMVAGGALAATATSGLLSRRFWRRAGARGLLGRRVRGPLAGWAVLLAAALVSLSWLLPARSAPPSTDQALVNQWLTRPDGNALAVHVIRAAAATEPPLIVVHGGPGVADMADDAAAFAPLATDRDVYVYDRVGTGSSSRLPDPLGYTTARAVADLEALRIHIGAAQVVLHGHSWGARIAVAYAQDHPDRVAALVLSAPGDLALDQASQTAGDLTTRLDAGQRTRLYLRLVRPRNLFTYALTAADVRLAHWMAGDAEMDRRFAAIYRDSAPALFCDARLAGRVGTAGLGYYAHYVPQLHPDPRDEPVDLHRLAAVTAPVLLIKPACDYLPWSTAGYRRALPQAELVLVPNAGHVAYLEQPTLYVDLLQAFLHGRKLPLPKLDGDAVPPTYRGTR